MIEPEIIQLSPKAKENGRIILTSQGGPNMPKRQPCPQCGKWVKRGKKTESGAYYFHKKCDCGWFVSEARSDT